MAKKPTIGFISLGCPKNQVDTEIMLHKIHEAGYDITPNEGEADIVIVNTCAFIQSAKEEAVDTVLDIAELKNDNLKAIIVTGCLSQMYKEELLSELPEVDAVVGVASMKDIVSVVDKIAKGEKKIACVRDLSEFEFGKDRILTTPEFAPYIKIAEGCDHRCTYCVIPNLRGSFKSRPLEDIISEAKDLEALGAKELTIVAQDITSWGVDIYGKPSLALLIGEITKNTNIPWIRLLYGYMDKIDDELIEEMRTNERVLHYIDLPIQHMSNDVLRRMNRRDKYESIVETAKKLRKAIPDIVIRSTVIVGFPGETEEDFETLCRGIKEVKFERLGVFKYSREEGTPAYSFEDQINEQTKQDRQDILMETQIGISEKFLSRMLSKTLLVLCEGYDRDNKIYYGRSYADAADIDGKVYFRAKHPCEPGEFVKVKITDTLDYDLLGEEA
ncbi:MAG: 30S ribosomal protein S12 methylthiotransferase RimO [Clostridia bacterium]|nr:30S ribosomal protein S12 methylthiotransferase RimO [Clostridia bacterium]